VGPGKVLQGLVRRIVPDAPVFGIDGPAAADGLSAELIALGQR